VVTSPPTGPPPTAKSPPHAEQGHKYHHRYGNTLDRGNLANIGHHRLLGGFTTILTATTAYLRPGGHVVITIRPWREHAELIDLPSQILACGIYAGLIPTERCVALLARVADNDLVARAASSSATSSSNNAEPAYLCTSSPTKMCSCSNGL
jgi:hypothetical protein